MPHVIKSAAFLPRDGETSVFRHGADPHDQLWALAHDYALGTRTLHGAAIVKARVIRAAGLEVRPDEPPPPHAVIAGWAAEGVDPAEAKVEQKRQALLLAEGAGVLLP